MFKLMVFVWLFFSSVMSFAVDNKSFNTLISRPGVRQMEGVYIFKSDYENLMKWAFQSTGGEIVTLKPFGLHDKSVLGSSFEDHWRLYHNFTGMNVQPNVQMSVFYDENQRIKKIVIESGISDLEVMQRGYHVRSEVISLEFNYIGKDIISVNLLRFWDSNAFKESLNNISASMMKIDSKQAEVFLTKSSKLIESLSKTGLHHYVDNNRFAYSNYRNQLSKIENFDLMNKILGFMEQANVYNNQAKNADFIDNKVYFEQTDLYDRYKQVRYFRAIGLMTVFGISSLFFVDPNALSGAVLSLVLWRYHALEMKMSATDDRTEVKYKDLTPKALRNSIKRMAYYYFDLFQKMNFSFKDRFVGTTLQAGYLETSYEVINTHRKASSGATCSHIFN